MRVSSLVLMQEGKVKLMQAIDESRGHQPELRNALTILNCAIRLEEKKAAPASKAAWPAGVQRCD